MSDSKEETKQETKEETKEETTTRETRSEAVLNREHANIIQYLMTHPETGERMSYEESRMMHG